MPDDVSQRTARYTPTGASCPIWHSAGRVRPALPHPLHTAARLAHGGRRRWV